MQSMKRNSVGREGWWTTHKYSRRAVIDLSVESFCGWQILLDMVEAANEKERYTPLEFPYCSERDKALVSTAFETGGRLSEVVMLRKSMFTIGDEWITVEKMPLLKRYRKLKNGETRRTPTTRDFLFPRTEPLAPFVVQRVEEAQDYLFPSRYNRKNKHLGYCRAYQIICDLARRVNFNCWPHRLRSERASQLGNEYKWSLEKILRFFYWKSASMGLRYSHSGLEDMKLSMPQIDYGF